MNEEMTEELRLFQEKCEEVAAAKFLISTYKISELLRTLATLPHVLAVISERVARYDYAVEKERCFRAAQNDAQSGVLVLPSADAEKIAFVFCLLMDVDGRELDFPAFLLAFYDVKGDYDEAYKRFGSEIVLPFAAAVKAEIEAPVSEVKAEIAPELEDEETVENTTEAEEKRFSLFPKKKNGALVSLIEEEKSDLKKSTLSATEKAAGGNMLRYAIKRAKAGENEEVKALLSGYAYFLMATARRSDTAVKMLEALKEL